MFFGATGAGSSFAASSASLSVAAKRSTAAKASTAKGPARTHGARTPSACRYATLLPTPWNLAKVTAATLCLINRERAARKLKPLRQDTRLQSVASGQAVDMVAGDYFGDDSLNGQTPTDRLLQLRYVAPDTRYHVAQNIGWGTGVAASPLGMVRAWMRSPGHRRNILTPEFRDSGVGTTAAVPTTIAAGVYGATYTVEFGSAPAVG
ncbi:MAG TPA: CAP domain-containing protein [Solirubrobacteraceae bacterium]|nr:CAP domain-containing protein [Solirubrobacteraceae bacterium]